MDRYERQLKKGVLEILVLKLLSDEKKYGYQLISQLKELGKGMFSMKEGTLYPILYRLQDDGLVTSDWSEPGDKESPRKYYSITVEGQKTLIKLVDLWSEFAAEVSRVLEGGESNGN